ncbi:MAG TPA: hypothetical protein VFI06_04740 [Chitinophagaceae bacterium]|nr:hypothetical protein [Chitinophagaceae bacterium]
MENDITRIITGFRNSSSRIFEMIYNDFKRNVKNVNRKTDENVFQQMQARYINELENQLRQLAEKTVAGYNEPRESKILQHELASQISYLLSEFQQKAKSR